MNVSPNRNTGEVIKESRIPSLGEIGTSDGLTVLLGKNCWEEYLPSMLQFLFS